MFSFSAYSIAWLRAVNFFLMRLRESPPLTTTFWKISAGVLWLLELVMLSNASVAAVVSLCETLHGFGFVLLHLYAFFLGISQV